MGPWVFAWICSPQLPYHPCENRMHSTCFYSTGGHTPTCVELKATSWAGQMSATAKRGFWKRCNCVKFGFLALTFLSSSYLWRLFGHLCSNVSPEMDPAGPQKAPKPSPSQASEWPPAVRKFCGKIFGKMRKLSEIVFLTSWTSSTVKQGVRKMSENVGNLTANFLRTPEVQSALQTPLCTALSSLQFCGLGFSCLVAHWHHNSQRFEPSISLPNSHGPFANNQAMVK